MDQTAARAMELDSLAPAFQRIERRLGLALLVLVVSIVGILGITVGQTAAHFLIGPELRAPAVMDGAGCGSHLEFDLSDRTVNPGTRVRFENDTVYWQIPIVVERRTSDGTFNVVGESGVLRGGEAWTFTFWRRGDYRISSADESQRLAGLVTTLAVK